MTDEPPIGFLFAVYTAGLACPTCGGTTFVDAEPDSADPHPVDDCPSCDRLAVYVGANFPHVIEGKK